MEDVPLELIEDLMTAEQTLKWPTSSPPIVCFVNREAARVYIDGRCKMDMALEALLSFTLKIKWLDVEDIVVHDGSIMKLRC